MILQLFQLQLVKINVFKTQNINKRTLMSSIKKTITKIPYNNRVLRKTYPRVQEQGYKTQIHDTNPIKASHEQSQINPIIQVGVKKVIRHPIIGIAYCEKAGCVKKECNVNDVRCGETTKVEAIGHGTHSDSTKVPSSQYLSNTDFKGDSRPQNAVFYPAVKRIDILNSSQTYNENATREANNNEEMKNNIAMYKKLNDE